MCRMNLDETVCVMLLRARVLSLHLVGGAAVVVRAVMLPVSDPIDEHLADLHVGDRHLFDAVHLQCRRVQHLLDGAGR